jgi:hypothetical protein
MNPIDTPPAAHWSELETRARAGFAKFDELRGFL